jgi:hypothetical protein
VAVSRALVNQPHFQAELRRPQRSRGSRLVLVPWVLAVVVLAGLVAYATLHPYADKRPSAVKLAALGGLLWGDTVVWNKRQMRFWLHLHGAPYPTWEKRHPAALRIITHKKHHRAHRRR